MFLPPGIVAQAPEFPFRAGFHPAGREGRHGKASAQGVKRFPDHGRIERDADLDRQGGIGERSDGLGRLRAAMGDSFRRLPDGLPRQAPRVFQKSQGFPGNIAGPPQIRVPLPQILPGPVPVVFRRL